jgi:phage tail-like protein
MKLLVQTDASGTPMVDVPSRDDARRCAVVPQAGGGCTPTVVAFDPPDGTTLIDLGPGNVAVHVRVTPGVLDGDVPELIVHALPVGAPPSPDMVFVGHVEGACRDRIVFPNVFTPSTANGTYLLSLAGYAGPSAKVALALGPPNPLGLPVDPCALTLAPSRAPVGVALDAPPKVWPRPPLLSVDSQGCVVAAWSVSERGWTLVPRDDGSVDLMQSCRGGVRANIRTSSSIVDAIFWDDVIAVLTNTHVALYDLAGCPILPDVFSVTFVAAVALAVSDEGFLIVIDSGAMPNVYYLRGDGSRTLAPAAFDARGWYARHRSPAFVISEVDGSYSIDPSRAATAKPACDLQPARALTNDEALLFELIDDLPDLRERLAYPTSGWVILGAAQEGDALDAGRLGTQWHRILLFGDIPPGCAVGVETLTFDDPLLAVLLRSGAPQPSAPAWSTMVVASAASAGPVESPSDLRTAAGDVMVLAGPGRFLWIRLTLQSDGRSTPRITSIEIEQPRSGTSQYLPKVIRDSTPDDDFLRRWLALFETTSWSGMGKRMDAYAQIFDPRAAPAAMLPYLAAWLEIPLFPSLVANSDRLRHVLTRANEIAEGRGTVDGLLLVIQLYLGIVAQIVESFATRSRFVLGTGKAIFGAIGPTLGADTILTAEPSPTYVGDEPLLGGSYLMDTDERDGAVAFHFEVLVPARAVCSGETLSLLRALIDAEKPAFTTYSIRLVGEAGWVLGSASVLGQEVRPGFDRRRPDPSTYGLALLNGPPRPKPLGLGFTLGRDSRLDAPIGLPEFQVEATVGRTTRVGA